MPGPPNQQNRHPDVLSAGQQKRPTLPSTPSARISRYYPSIGLADSRTASGKWGASLWGSRVMVKLGGVEGIEVQLFGLSAGLDLSPPGVKLPRASARIAFDDGTAIASARSANK